MRGARPRLTRPTRRRKGRGHQLRQALGALHQLTHEAATVSELSAALRVHRRTVWRVLAAIRAAGLPLRQGRDPSTAESRYRLRAGWLDPVPSRADSGPKARTSR